MEFVNVVFDDFSFIQRNEDNSNNHSKQPKTQKIMQRRSEDSGEENDDNLDTDCIQHVHRNYLSSDLIGDVYGETTRGIQIDFREMVIFACFVSVIEPKHHKKLLKFWIVAMQDELEQFIRNNIWKLVPRSKDVNWN